MTFHRIGSDLQTSKNQRKAPDLGGSNISTDTWSVILILLKRQILLERSGNAKKLRGTVDHIGELAVSFASAGHILVPFSLMSSTLITRQICGAVHITTSASNDIAFASQVAPRASFRYVRVISLSYHRRRLNIRTQRCFLVEKFCNTGTACTNAKASSSFEL
ncbi:hypothetical protein B0H34DRAFT_273282 [Crassisporium funariophilum]|nr:hypothetical protein B0H34DRAFT_273282 [Crassisporium funariophilum]